MSSNEHYRHVLEGLKLASSFLDRGQLDIADLTVKTAAVEAILSLVCAQIEATEFGKEQIAQMRQQQDDFLAEMRKELREMK